MDGQLSAAPLAETFQQLENWPDSMAWIGLYRPTEAQLMSAAEQLRLHELAVADAVTARQRPKLERFGPDPRHVRALWGGHEAAEVVSLLRVSAPSSA